jgi:DNA adenine methylase
MTDLLSMLDDLDDSSDKISADTIVKAPFGWPGGKSRSIKHIIPLLPYKDVWCDHFGGSGTVTLARRPCKLEIYNDRFSGLTDLYRCIQDPVKLQLLVDRLEHTIHSKETFLDAKSTWKNFTDPVERAAKFYEMVVYSFGKLGRNWGRARVPTGRVSGILRDALPNFYNIHERFKYVQIENVDFRKCMKDYDSDVTVHYCDPDYVDTSAGVYAHGMSVDDHKDLLRLIFEMKGFVAVSGLANPLYDGFKWDDRRTWNSYCSIKSINSSENNNKGDIALVDEGRGHQEEVLWIKDFR